MNQRKRLKEGRQKRLIATPLIIRALFKNVTGNEVSLRYIQKAHDELLISKTDQSLTYGEVVASSFLQILGYTAPPPSEEDATSSRVFYDLGCGTGRAVICAALSPYPFSKVVGIELVPDLCDAAVGVKECFLTAIAESCTELGDSSSGGIEAKATGRNTSTEGLKVKKKEMHLLSEIQLIERIKEIVQKIYDEGYGASTQEYICNELTKQLGHKVYRASLQPLGKFSKFIGSKTDSFDISPDGSLSPLGTLKTSGLICDFYDCDGAEVVTSVENVRNSVVRTESADANSINVKSISLTDENLLESNISIKNDDVIDIADEIHGISIEECTESTEMSPVHTRESKISAVKSILLAPTGFLEAILPVPVIDLIQGDIFLHNWHEDADVVYAASLLFTDNMIEKLTDQVMKMKKGSWMVSLKPLKSPPGFHEKVILKDRSFHKMSWHMAEVYFYQIIS